MTKKEFYNEVTKKIKEGLAELRMSQAFIDKIEEKRKESKTFYERERLLKDIGAEKLEIESKKRRFKEEIETITNEFVNEMRKLDSYDPKEMTEDCKLFNSGITLSARDLYDIIDRNTGNRTMARLAVNYGREHGIKEFEYGMCKYVFAEDEANEICGTIKYSANMILNDYKLQNASEQIFDAVLGENSDIFKWCNL